MKASCGESFERQKAWAEKSDIEIRGMLARVDGKHRELCLEAQSRIGKQIDMWPVFDVLDRLYRDGYRIIQTDPGGGFYLANSDGGVEMTGDTFRDLCVNIVLAGL
jgi:hypothetical protein